MRNQFVFFSLIIFSCLSERVFAQDDCELVTTRDGISISKCDVAGSDYDGVLVEFEAKGDLEDYLKIASDPRSFVSWHYKIDKVEVLNDQLPQQAIYRSEIETPWPLTTREMVMRLEIERSKNGASVITRSVPEYIPPKEDFHRIPYAFSKIEVEVSDTKRMKFRYYVEANPGGQIPAWIINMFSTQGPYYTFSRLRSMLAERA